MLVSGKDALAGLFALTFGAGAGAAVVISSHLLALVEDVCTHLLILNRGKRLFFGRVDEARTAFADPGARASLEEVFFRAIEPSAEPRDT